MDDLLVSDVRFVPPLSWQPHPVTAEDCRVLVADDDPGIAGALADLLHGEGYRVRTVPDGQAALEQIAREPADLIVADVTMPRLDGVALADTLRERGDRTPVVLTSGVYAGVDLPGVRFVPKPFDLEYMARVVERVLAETRAAVA